jgi:hypothetical protein
MKVNVSFTVEIPTENASNDDILEWVKFELGAKWNLSSANALNFTDIQSCNVKDVSVS